MFGQPYKNDPYDARLLADFIYRKPMIDKRSGAQVVMLPSTNISMLKKLSRYQLELVRESTRYKLKLKKLLTGCFPELKQVYRNIFSANCLALLSQGWSIKEINRKNITTIANIKAPLGKRSIGKTRAIKIKMLASSIYPTPTAKIDARIVASYTQRILKLAEEINSIDIELAAIIDQMPIGRKLLMYPGIGPRLAARILGETGEIHRFPNKDKYSAYCGVVCLENSSGKRQGSKAAKQVNYILKETFMNFAFISTQYNSKSAAYYKRKRNEGFDHWAATKRLAHQLCKMIFKTLQTEKNDLKLVANF
jgi:hypothetical protein